MIRPRPRNLLRLVAPLLRRFQSEEYVSDRVPIVKSSKYYEEQQVLRRYYYVIDTRGGLFLEDTAPRNIATSLKDKRFLTFFYKQMRKNSTGLHEDTYPYVSLCGKELNFVLPLDPNSALVYTELSVDKKLLYYGGRVATDDFSGSGIGGKLGIPGKSFGSAFFEPKHLAFNSQSGRLYYPIMNHRHFNRNMNCVVGNSTLNQDLAMSSGKFTHGPSVLEYGLLHPHLCQQLGAHINYCEGDQGDSVISNKGCWSFDWEGSSVKLRVLE